MTPIPGNESKYAFPSIGDKSQQVCFNYLCYNIVDKTKGGINNKTTKNPAEKLGKTKPPKNGSERNQFIKKYFILLLSVAFIW